MQKGGAEKMSYVLQRRIMKWWKLYLKDIKKDSGKE